MVNFLKELFESFGLDWESSGISFIVFFFTTIGAILVSIWKLILYLIQKLKEFRLNQNLHPYFSKKEVHDATKIFIDTRCQNISPSNGDEPRDTHAFVTNQKLIPFFLNKAFKYGKKDDQRFFLILADSGMGKTTFMINLYLAYIKKNWLKKGNRIKLLPLGGDFDVLDEIKLMSDKEKYQTILLLDGFDEDSSATLNYQNRLREILTGVWKFKQVVLTCRTQFFPSQLEEPNQTGILKLAGDKGEHFFSKIYLTPLSDSDVNKYIRKKFSLLRYRRRKRAFKVVRKCPNLMVRPMLLNYIGEIIAPTVMVRSMEITFKLIPEAILPDWNGPSLKYKFKYKTVSSFNINRFGKVYQIYETLIQKWIEREGSRKATEREVFMRELHSFSKEIALNMYEMRHERGGYFIHQNEINDFATRHKIILDDLEMRSRSLLNRNSEGFYKFSHRSIMEYFLAKEAIENDTFRINLDERGLDVLVQFLEEQLEVNWLFNNRNNLNGRFSILTVKPNLMYDGGTDISSLMEEDVPNLKFLMIENRFIPSLHFLMESCDLEKLILRENELINYQTIGKLGSLEYLDLSKNKLQNCNMIQSLTSLKVLILSYNNIESGDTLSELVNLELLYIHNNQLTDCDFLKKLTNLNTLALIFNQITDFSPILSLDKLKVLHLPKSIKENQLSQIKNKLPNCKIILA